MSVQGMLLKVAALPERMQLAVEAGAKRILIPSENKRDLAEVPDDMLNRCRRRSTPIRSTPRSGRWGWNSPDVVDCLATREDLGGPDGWPAGAPEGLIVDDGSPIMDRS